ncbi:MAG TPA: PAS domain-containing protein, partial [Dongiaceae bacterium]
MARADVASASARSDSIKGLAQSIAKPAYRRLLFAEPALRRAVPALIIAFLVTISIGAIVEVLDHRREALNAAIGDVRALGDLVAERFQHLPPSHDSDLARRAEAGLRAAMPSWGRAPGRILMITNEHGLVIAATPREPATIGSNLLDILGPAQPLTTFGAAAGVMQLTRPEGQVVLATVRTLPPPFGQLAVMQPRTDALAVWRADTTLTVTLSATTGFIVLILGFAFHWQATRAREADLIYDTVRSRIDTALNRGRCGLWDWNLGSGRIFWSQSMFAMLGLPPSDDLLTFGEVNALVHPQDINLYEIATQLAEARALAIDHAFRMRHADGSWVWLRARCELVRQPREPGLHLIGIAVDITEQKSLAERSAAADIRLRDAIETIPEAFVLWDAENRMVLCNSNFQDLHHLSDEAIAPGTSFETIVAAGRKPVVHTKITSDSDSTTGARTFEALLDDGRWLHISERRTK